VAPLKLPSRMTATDALFWYAESALPIFRPIIAGLYILDRPPDRRRFEQCLHSALQLVPRLRQRVVETPWHLGMPEWAEDPHFDPAYHVRHVSLPPPGSQRALLDFVAALFATPLDRERPLWEAYWIDGLADRRSAYFFKLHHSLVDGVGAVALFNALTLPSRRAPIPRCDAPARAATAAPRGAAQLAALTMAQGAAAAELVGQAARLPSRLIAHPSESLAALRATAQGVRGMLADLGRDSVRDPLAGDSTGLSRRFDVMRIPLERLRAVKEPLGVTINDVVLTMLAGALGSYHRERRVRVAALNCMVPMNLRAADEREALGNRVGTFVVRLPLTESRPARRLALIAHQTRRAKTDRRGAAAPLLLNAAVLLPGFALRWMAKQSLGKVNVACTNVPGVRERRYMAGALVEAVYPFASVVEGTPLVMALLSYAGTMHVGIDTDPEAIPDPRRLHTLLTEQLRALERLAAARRHRASRGGAVASAPESARVRQASVG
jgi:WS/DGAT/MGAT family acyltransferase